MPEMDGYEATSYIRNEMNLSIPIIAMTASALKGEKSKCLEIGMNDYLSKPFDFAFIYKRISMLLSDSPVSDGAHVVEELAIESLFDLSLLREMDDNEYSSEILTIFLDNTPTELNELKRACIAHKFETAGQTAHKLKSSTGLLKINRLLHVLIEIEACVKAEKTGTLEKLAEMAIEEYKKVEIPLKEHLRNIQEGLSIAI